MVLGRLRLAVVVTHNGADNLPVASVETWNIAVQRQIFSMFMVATVADAMADIVEQRAGFQLNAGLHRHVVHGLKLVEKHDAELADVLGVLLVVFEAAAETARSH